MWSKRIKILILAVVIGVVMCPKLGLAAPASKGNRQYVHTESFIEDHSMTGLFSQCTEYFSVGTWNINKAEFNMVYNVTQLRDEKISDFTISLNGEPFYSRRLTDKAGETKTLKIKLPVRLIKKGINELKIESYIRTSESLPCVDDVSKANWMNISKDSAISILYTPDVNIKSVADLYHHITSIYGMENGKSALIVPDNASDTDMTIAANILTGISKNSSVDYQNLMLLRESNLFKGNNLSDFDYGIYVGELASLPAVVFDGLSEEAKKEAKNGAVLSIVSLEHMNLLVLTGTNQELLLKGGTMFGNDDYMKQMTGRIHVVTEDENPQMEKREQLEYSNLTEEGAYVKGAFRQTVSFQEASYGNKTLSPSSAIYLKVRYSQNLDFERSLLTVYINDVPIGSHKLSKEKANGDEIELYIPSDLKVSGDFTVKMAFDLELEDVWCTLRQGETPWAYVSPESMIKIVLAEDVPLLFEHYPAPFIKNKSLNDVFVALPENPSFADLTVLRGVCLTLGRFVEDNTGSIMVTQGAKMQDCRGKNTIVIGSFANNLIVRESNKNLYFKFNEAGTSLLTNEKKQITKEAGSTMGTIQLVDSPFGEENRGMMFITGATEQGMLSAAKYLSDTEKLWKVTGDGCVVEEGKIYAYQFKDNRKSQITTTKELLKREDVLRFLIVSISIAGVLVVGLVLIIVKYVRGGKNTRKNFGKKGGKPE